LRVLLLAVVVFAAMAAFLWWRTRQTRFGSDDNLSRNAESATGSVVERSTPAATPTASSGPTTESPAPSEPPADAGGSDKTATPSDNSQPTNAAPSESFVGTLKLIIPVVGVRPDQLTDTFADARSDSRVHDAIDIPAPAGTAVVAAADGEIVKLFQSERGGTTVYQLSADKKFVFYYAHLQSYADSLAVGKFVRQGEVIAYVGDTGNAGAGNFHLHFSISVINDPKRYWEGTNINPYPLLQKQ
jgi:murein DD-endopeptidase MepM/ murein hydrolase activator NlpD